MASARLAVDIGGTFTDLALEHGGKRTTVKVLTTPSAPEQGVMAGVQAVLQAAGVAPADIAIVIHGTTLATNAIIERKGAKTALVTTQGFRDVLAMRNESRYDQYDLNIVLPEPLVPRHLRLPVPERLDNEGKVLLALDEGAVRALVTLLRREGVEAIAVGLLVASLNGVADVRNIILGFVLLLGIGMFLFAMRWDSSDPARVTRRSDVAFWLHLLAAPMIVHPVFTLLGLNDGNATIGEGLVVVLLYVVLGITALAIDRRALLVSSLAYVLFALQSMFRQFGAVELNVALTALVIGSALLLLSAFWHQARRMVVSPLPTGLRSKLPNLDRVVITPLPAA